MTYFSLLSFFPLQMRSQSPATLPISGKADSSPALLRQRPGALPLPGSCLLHAKPCAECCKGY